MYDLITTKGRAAFETIEAAAAWLAEMQPSSTRVEADGAGGEVEWETQDDDDAETAAIVEAIRKALA